MSIKYYILLIFYFTYLPLTINAQQFRPQKSSDIYKKLEQLQRIGTVMYIAAHPDDENTRLITYLVHHDHINTIYLSLTRGDGGQNIIGNEQGAALGLIRTNEMMMARKIDGGKQLFTRFIDFGYTKSPIETFNFWNKKQVIDDIKHSIQQHKPDILICRFPTTGEGGHGQHTASAIAALEAFKEIQASKDPNIFKPKRILFNAFKFGTSNTIKPGQFELATNQFDPILGEAYGEMAGRSRSEHKSQGAGTPQSFGISNENFELMAGAPFSKSIYDDIDTSWNRIGLKNIGIEISNILSKFNFSRPEESIDNLLIIKYKLEENKSKNLYWITKKIQELDDIILACSGLQFEILSKNPTAIKGENIDLDIKAIARTNTIKINKIAAFDQDLINQTVILANDSVWQSKFKFTIPETALITQPYWLEKQGNNNQFVYPIPYQNEPLSNNNFIVKVSVSINNVPFEIEVPISFKKLDPTRGDVIEAVRIMPDVDLEPVPASITISKGESFHVGAAIYSRIDINDATLEIMDASGKKIASESGLSFKKDERKLVFSLVPANSLKSYQNPEKIFYRLVVNGKIHDKQLHLIQYPHIPTLQYFTTASSFVITESWKSNVKNIGYISGAGDKVEESLTNLGFNVTTLNINDLANYENLKKYDAIVCGIRIANTRKDIEKYIPNLWKYIENGGNVIMQYNTSMGLEINNFSPFPITLSRNRITDEKAAISFVDTKSPILNTPNKITNKDFDNWVQERGIYFPETWDNAFQTVLKMNDPDEKPLDGGIIYAKYGKGYFVYTSLVFFRQIPESNIGAIRLFINLLNIGKN